MKDQIKSLITNSLPDKFSTAHGITNTNIEEHLVAPILETYFLPQPSGENVSEDLWTVLYENPLTKTGYSIYYDPEMKAFGLGLINKDDSMTGLGVYGSFFDTLEAM